MKIDLQTIIAIVAIIISFFAFVSSLHTAWLTRTSTRPLIIIDSATVSDCADAIPQKKKFEVTLKNIGVNPAENIKLNIDLVSPNCECISASKDTIEHPLKKDGTFTYPIYFTYSPGKIGQNILFVYKIEYSDSFFPKKWFFRRNIYKQKLYSMNTLGENTCFHPTYADIKNLTTR